MDHFLNYLNDRIDSYKHEIDIYENNIENGKYVNVSIDGMQRCHAVLLELYSLRNTYESIQK